MTAQDILTELKALGNERTKKMWLNAGNPEPCLGVKVEDMKKILKRVKTDYRLALELYDTGITDAMYLAGLMADDAKMTEADLQKWIAAAPAGWVSEYTVPWVAAGSAHGRELALRWMDAREETIATAGWQTYGSVAAITEDAGLDLPEIKKLLHRAAAAIHQQPERVQWAMNAFVIAIGCYVKPLYSDAMDTARAIGAVQQPGPKGSSCGSIPFAPDRIEAFAARSQVGKKRKSAKC